MFTNVFHFQALLGFATNPPTPLHIDCKQPNTSVAIYLHRSHCTVFFSRSYRLNEYVSLHDRITVLYYRLLKYTIENMSTTEIRFWVFNYRLFLIIFFYIYYSLNKTLSPIFFLVFSSSLTILIPYVSTLIY